MRVRTCLVALAFAAPFAAAPTRAGGPGVNITAIHGTVDMKPLATGVQQWRPAGGKVRLRREKLVGDHWRPLKTGEVIGTYLLRTGKRSWVHLMRNAYCVDANSLLRIESGCGYRITVLRGQVSRADGKRGKPLPRIIQEG